MVAEQHGGGQGGQGVQYIRERRKSAEQHRDIVKHTRGGGGGTGVQPKTKYER